MPGKFEERVAGHCFLVMLLLALVAVLAGCGGPEEGPFEQCTYPLVYCEGDPELCPVTLPTCRVLEVAR